MTPEQMLLQKMHQDDNNVSPIHQHDRRGTDRYWELALQHLADLSESQHKINDKIEAHISNSHERHEALAAKITGSDAVIAAILDGFPNKDPRGHLDAHISWIEDTKARKEFWSKMVTEITKYGLLGVLGWLFTIAWGAMLKGPK